MMDIILLILVVAAAVLYLARWFKKMAASNESSCGCGCTGCSQLQKEIQK